MRNKNKKNSYKVIKITGFVLLQIFICSSLLWAAPTALKSSFLSPQIKIDSRLFLRLYQNSYTNSGGASEERLFPTIGEQHVRNTYLIDKIAKFAQAAQANGQFSPTDTNNILKSLEIAKAVYEAREFSSKTPELYLHHVLEVAEVLIGEEGTPAEVIIAALFHRMSEQEIRSFVKNKKIKKKAVDEIIRLINKFLDIAEFSYAKMNLKGRHSVQNFMNDIIRRSTREESDEADPRIMKLILADKLASIKFASEIDRKELIKEIEDIYAPLAHRLGAVHLKDKLLEEFFKLSMPSEYKQTREIIKSWTGVEYEQLEEHLHDLKAELEEKTLSLLKDYGKKIDVRISTRVKGLYEFYEKLQEGGNLNDLLGIRFICDAEPWELRIFSPVIQEKLGPWSIETKGTKEKKYDESRILEGMLYIDYHSSDSLTEYPYEIQILTKQGHETREREKPHWAYKLGKRLGQMFDVEEYVPLGNFDDDFKRVFNALKDFVFVYTVIRNPGTGGGYIRVNRLEIGSIPADLAASQAIDKFYGDYERATIYDWKNGVLVDKGLQHNTEYELQSGDFVEFYDEAKNPSLSLRNNRTMRLNIIAKAKRLRTHLILTLIELGKIILMQEKVSVISDGEKSLKEEFEKMGVKTTEGAPIFAKFLNPYARSKGLKNEEELYLVLTHYPRISVSDVIEEARRQGEKIISKFNFDEFTLGQVARNFYIDSSDVFYIQIGTGQISIDDDVFKSWRYRSGVDSDIRSIELAKLYNLAMTFARDKISSSQHLKKIVKVINKVIEESTLENPEGAVRMPQLKGKGKDRILAIEFSVYSKEIAKVDAMLDKLREEIKLTLIDIRYDDKAKQSERKLVIQIVNSGQRIGDLSGYIEDNVSRWSTESAVLDFNWKKKVLENNNKVIEIVAIITSDLTDDAFNQKVAKMKREKIERNIWPGQLYEKMSADISIESIIMIETAI